MKFARFPEYGPREFEALSSLSRPVMAAFEEAGYVRAEPPIIQPADIFLDLYGEAVRRRIYVFTGPQGDELCLRPDLTVPLARMCLGRLRRRGEAMKLGYCGPAFRSVAADDGRAAQFLQAGVERLGGTGDAAAADAEIFALIHDAVRRTCTDGVTLHFGDLGLFAAFADALDLPEAWRGRLKRRFRSPAAIHDLLMRTARQAEGTQAMGALLTALSHLSEAEARAALRDVLGLAGIDSVGGRSLEEITERFLEQAAAASAAGLPAEMTALIRRFVGAGAVVPRAVETLARLTREAGINLDGALETLARRLDAIRARGIDPDTAEFSTAFGRDMDYYTGFVFEFRAPALGANAKIAGGGRYDTLLTRLGAAAPVAAVGGSVWVERLAAIAGTGPEPAAARKVRGAAS